MADRGFGARFRAAVSGGTAPQIDGLRSLHPDLTDTLRSRYLGDKPQAIYLIRPDQVIAARWISADETQIKAALAAAWEGR